MAARLRPGNVHSVDGWEEVLWPESARPQKLGKEVVCRAAAALAQPEVYAAREVRDLQYALRIPTNDILERDMTERLPRLVGRPRQKVGRVQGVSLPGGKREGDAASGGEGRASCGELFPRGVS